MYGDPVDKIDRMFEQDMYFSVFHCFFSVRERWTDMLKEHKREER